MSPIAAGRSLNPEVERSVDAYLANADRLLRDRIIGFYLVGSTALDAWVIDRSDIDFVAVVDHTLSRAELRRLRAVWLIAGFRPGIHGVTRALWAFPGTMNGIFVSENDLTRPVSQIAPIASHCGPKFSVARAFDLNPVQWKTFRDHGVAIRGPEPSALGLDPEPHTLRQWTLDNLNTYWASWARRACTGRDLSWTLQPRWRTAWGVQGTSRMHATISTGEIISKATACEYAIETFDERWHPIIDEAHRYWRGDPEKVARFDDRRRRMARTGEFALDVIANANEHAEHPLGPST